MASPLELAEVEDSPKSWEGSETELNSNLHFNV